MKQKKTKVLIVEDALFLREVMFNLLKNQGMEVLACSSVLEALNKHQAFCPDILLTDLALPEVSGLTLIEKFLNLTGLENPVTCKDFPPKEVNLKHEKSNKMNINLLPNLAIVLCSGLKQTQVELMLGDLNKQVRKFIPKPFSSDELIRTLNSIAGEMQNSQAMAA